VGRWPEIVTLVTVWLIGAGPGAIDREGNPREVTPFRLLLTYEDTDGRPQSMEVWNDDTVAWFVEFAKGDRSRRWSRDFAPGEHLPNTVLPAQIRNASSIYDDYYLASGPRA
jgi:hypothetical protein